MEVYRIGMLKWSWESSPDSPCALSRRATRRSDSPGEAQGLHAWAHSADELVNSTTKRSKDIVLRGCGHRRRIYHSEEEQIHLPLFPLHLSPYEWNSECGDAYKYSWKSTPEAKRLLASLTPTQVHRLSASMGFCPHLRCQLDNVGSSLPGQCPPGLCYSKIENGAVSFGGCCFNSDGSFLTSELIGDFNRSQPTAKPIYRHSRLKHSSGRFLNGNWLTPNLLATQCPMEATLNDLQDIILQHNVTLWVQLSAPHQLTTVIDPTSSSLPLFNANLTRAGKDCHLLPIAWNHTQYRHMVESVHKLPSDWGSSLEEFDIKLFSNTMRYMWFSKWGDFSADEGFQQRDRDALEHVVQSITDSLKKRQKVVVSCYSGRGRTGSLAAAALARHLHINTVDEFTDLVVSMRENRDGIVETPRQFNLAARLARIPDPSVCNMICNTRKTLDSIGITEKQIRLGINLTFLVLTLSAIFILLYTGPRRRRKIKEKNV